ncbi:MAG: hypothetical protein ACR2OH_08150, partial [Microthrixaceae bacterium]
VGSIAEPDSHRVELRPRSLVPSGALGSAPKEDAHVTAAIRAGEVLVESRIAGPGETGTAVPAGRVALDIEMPRQAPSLGVGDHVVILTSAAEPLVGVDVTDTPEAVVVATDAVVLASVEAAAGTVLTAAVAESELPATAAASISGELIVVKRNPR